MEFDIYVGGDPGFFRAAAVFLSMLHSDGSNLFFALAGIGALLGVLFVAIKGAAQGGGGLELSQVAVGIVIVLIFFGPTARVVIWDASDFEPSPQIPVDNVPFGPAAAFSLISRTLMSVTNTFSQGMALPDSTGGSALPGPDDSGYGGQLEMLYRIMRMMPGEARHFSDDVDMKRAVQTYLRDCTRIGIEQGTINTAKITSSENTLSAIELPVEAGANIFTTRNFLAAHGPMVTCEESFSALENNLNNAGSAFFAAYYNELESSLGMEVSATQINQALNAILGSSSANGWQLLRNTIVSRYVAEAEQAGVLSVADGERLTLLSSAESRTLTQAMLDANMFVRVMRPLMGFIEAFIFSMSALLALLMAFGGLGLALTAKYLKFVLWVGLWPVVLTFSHWFIAFRFDAAVKALNDSHDAIGSPLYIAQLQDELLHWVTTGGTMIAGIPMLTYAFISAAPVAFTSLAGAMKGNSAPEAASVTPQAYNPGTFTNMQDYNTTAKPSLGGQVNEASMNRLLGGASIAVTSSRDMAAQSAQQLGQMAQVEMGGAMEQTARSLHESGQSASMRGATSEVWRATDDQIRSQTETQARQNASEFGVSQGASQGFAQMATFGAAAGISASKLASMGLKGAFGDEVRNALSADRSSGERFASSLMANFSSEDRASLSTGFDSVLSNEESTFNKATAQAGTGASVRQAFSTRQQASAMRSYAQSDRVQEALSRTPDASVMLSNMKERGVGLGSINGSEALTQRALDYKNQFRHTWGSGGGLEQAAVFRAVSDGLHSDDEGTRQEALAAMKTIAPAALGLDGPIRGPEDSVSGDVANAIWETEAGRDAANASVNAGEVPGVAADPQAVAEGGRADVVGGFDTGEQRVRENADKAQAGAAKTALDNLFQDNSIPRGNLHAAADSGRGFLSDFTMGATAWGNKQADMVRNTPVLAAAAPFIMTASAFGARQETERGMSAWSEASSTRLGMGDDSSPLDGAPVQSPSRWGGSTYQTPSNVSPVVAASIANPEATADKFQQYYQSQGYPQDVARGMAYHSVGLAMAHGVSGLGDNEGLMVNGQELRNGVSPDDGSYVGLATRGEEYQAKGFEVMRGASQQRFPENSDRQAEILSRTYSAMPDWNSLNGEQSVSLYANQPEAVQFWKVADDYRDANRGVR